MRKDACEEDARMQQREGNWGEERRTFLSTSAQIQRAAKRTASLQNLGTPGRQRHKKRTEEGGDTPDITTDTATSAAASSATTS